MDRRNFFKVGSMAIAAAALTKFTGNSFGKVLANSASSRTFSLELITDNEDRAVMLAEGFINTQDTGNSVVKFSDYKLDTPEKGDLVYVKNGKLINYKSGTSDSLKHLAEIAKDLNLPKVISNPVRLRFYIQPEEADAKRFLVFHKQSLVKKISAGDTNSNINIAGTRGELVLNVSGRKARVVNSSCTHKNCVNTGSISLAGESIVCIPNEVHIIAE